MIKELIEENETLPYLFIGSGFSKRYLDLPNWEELMDYLATLTYGNKFEYGAVKTKVAEKIDKIYDYNKYMTTLCDYISADLNKVWFTSEKFKESREMFGTIVLNDDVPPIKVEISKYIDSKKEVVENMSSELDSLRNLTSKTIAGIITTNYDELLEEIFDYEVYRTQEDLLFQKNYGAAEIFKIHGCITDPDTIMINSKDYEKIEKQNKYIASKLLTMFVEHPIIFIGYGINDIDIKSILFDITQCLTSSQITQLEKRLIFISWDSEIKDIRESTHNINFEDGSSISISRFIVSNFTDVYEQLAEITSKYPLKLVRTFRKDLYELTLSEAPTEKIMVNLPEEKLADDDYKDIEYVLGFGVVELAKRGYLTPTARDIFYDVVLNNENYEPNSLLINTFPELSKMYGDLPRFKYLKDAKEETREFISSKYNDYTKFNDFLNSNLINRSSSVNSVAEAFNEIEGTRNQILNILSLEESQIDCEELESYLFNLLSNNSKLLDSRENVTLKTNLRKLIRIYDWLKFSEFDS